MDTGVLEIHEHTGEGYRALIDHGDWRVAILRCEDGLLPGRQSSMERHLETDEVFVLTRGEAMLIMGGNERQIGELRPQVMEIGKIYNIRKNAWHTLSLSEDAAIVIVENRDTGKHNSEMAELSEAQRRSVQAMTSGGWGTES